MNRLLQRLERSGRRAERERITSGCPPLDRLLPQQGFSRGWLAEWLTDGPGSGASTLALIAAREACRRGGVLAVVDRDGTFYPPAAAAWKIDLQSTIVVRPANDKDEHWALDQILRCEHVAAVLAWPRRLDGHTFRRLQLAAEASGCLGLLVRPSATRREPSWANVRLLVSSQTVGAACRAVSGFSLPSGVRSREDVLPGRQDLQAAPKKRTTNERAPWGKLPACGLSQNGKLEAYPTGWEKGVGPHLCEAPGTDRRLVGPVPGKWGPTPFSQGWRLRVQLLRCRGRFGGNSIELEIDHQTGEIHETHPGNLASQLVRPTASEHSA